MPHSTFFLAPGLGSFWLSVTLFALATSASPGPVNVVAASSGARFGLRPSLPYVAGASLGFALLLLGLGLGPGVALVHRPGFQMVLRVLGSLYLIHLAWRLQRSALPDEAPAADGPEAAAADRHAHCPPRWTAGLLAQWLNPKAWVVAAAGVSGYTLPGERHGLSVVLMAGVFFAVCLPSIGAWAASGEGMRHLLRSPATLRRFNRLMAAALLLSVLTLWWG